MNKALIKQSISTLFYKKKTLQMFITLVEMYTSKFPNLKFFV